jgi:hypothetical protein
MLPAAPMGPAIERTGPAWSGGAAATTFMLIATARIAQAIWTGRRPRRGARKTSAAYAALVHGRHQAEGGERRGRQAQVETLGCGSSGESDEDDHLGKHRRDDPQVAGRERPDQRRRIPDEGISRGRDLEHPPEVPGPDAQERVLAVLVVVEVSQVVADPTVGNEGEPGERGDGQGDEAHREGTTHSPATNRVAGERHRKEERLRLRHQGQPEDDREEPAPVAGSQDRRPQAQGDVGGVGLAPPCAEIPRCRHEHERQDRRGGERRPFPKHSEQPSHDCELPEQGGNLERNPDPDVAGVAGRREGGNQSGERPEDADQDGQIGEVLPVRCAERQVGREVVRPAGVLVKVPEKDVTGEDGQPNDDRNQEAEPEHWQERRPPSSAGGRMIHRDGGLHRTR